MIQGKGIVSTKCQMIKALADELREAVHEVGVLVNNSGLQAIENAAHGITVTALCFRFVQTEMTEKDGGGHMNLQRPPLRFQARLFAPDSLRMGIWQPPRP